MIKAGDLMSYSDQDYNELVERLKELCEREAEASEFILAITESGIINELSQQSAGCDIEQAALERIHKRDKELALKYEAKEAELELNAIYRIVKEKFMAEPSFVEYAIARIKDDLVESKESEECPDLYIMALSYCDKEDLKLFLVENFHEELIDKFRNELKNDLLHRHQEEFKEELRKELLENKEFVDKIKSEIIKDLAKKIFD